MNITEVSRYITPDGSEFLTKAKAEKYVAEVARLEAIMAPLAPRAVDFPHNGYLQHDLAELAAVWNDLLSLSQDVVGKHEWFEQSRDLKADPSWVSRLVNEYGHDALWRLGWFRMSCIDRKTGREYSRPYYSNHPEELPVIVRLNP